MNPQEYIKHIARKELARRNYSSYCQYVHGKGWFLGKHIKLVCDAVERLINREIKQNILIISMPP